MFVSAAPSPPPPPLPKKALIELKIIYREKKNIYNKWYIKVYRLLLYCIIINDDTSRAQVHFYTSSYINRWTSLYRDRI